MPRHAPDRRPPLALIVAACLILIALLGVSLLAGCSPAQATDFPDITETATPAPTRDASEDDTTVEEEAPDDNALVSHSINIMNRSGETIGEGEVRLYAPDTLALDDASEIRLEIFADVDEDSGTLFPPPSVTPVLSTPQPTATLLPMVEAQFIEIHQFMGAGLRGLHARRFNIDSVAADRHPRDAAWGNHVVEVDDQPRHASRCWLQLIGSLHLSACPTR